MKITVSTKVLKEALGAMSKIIGRKVTVPALNGVRIDSTEFGITISATVLEQSLTRIIGDAEGVGSFIVDMNDLKEYIKHCKSATTVQFENDDSSIAAVYHVDDIPVVRHFNTFLLEEWPEIPQARNPHRIQGDVFENIRKVIPSASKDDTRPVLNGILLEQDGVVATDGKQLVKLHCETGVKESVVIPVSKFIKSAAFAGDSATLSVENVNGTRFCIFSAENWIYSVKCISGQYPQYRQVIPKDTSCTVEFSDEAIEYLKQGIPQLECSGENRTVHFYADSQNFTVLSGNYTGTQFTVSAVCKGVDAVALSVNRDLLQRAVELGFSKFAFSDSKNIGPVLAEGQGRDFLVFMPLAGVDIEKIKSAAATASMKEKYKPVSRIHGKNEKSTEKEKKMPENKNTGFNVVGKDEADAFTKLLQNIIITQEKAKDVIECTKELTRLVKDLQRDMKTREREFKSTRDLLGKLKKVSGF